MSSDSSEEENLELLKEAQDTQFINDSMFSDSPEKASYKSSDDRSKKSLPSLRRTYNDDEQFNNLLKVTPEFRSYVAKQLSGILDRKLSKKFADLEAPQVPSKKRKGGVKLLTDSKHFLKVRKNITEDINLVQHNSRKKLTERNNLINGEVTRELLKEVSVSADDILSKKEVKNWSQRSKAPVFRYKKTKNGQLELIEPTFK